MSSTIFLLVEKKKLPISSVAGKSSIGHFSTGALGAWLSRCLLLIFEKNLPKKKSERRLASLFSTSEPLGHLNISGTHGRIEGPPLMTKPLSSALVHCAYNAYTSLPGNGPETNYNWADNFISFHVHFVWSNCLAFISLVLVLVCKVTLYRIRNRYESINFRLAINIILSSNFRLVGSPRCA